MHLQSLTLYWTDTFRQILQTYCVKTLILFSFFNQWIALLSIHSVTKWRITVILHPSHSHATHKSYWSLLSWAFSSISLHSYQHRNLFGFTSAYWKGSGFHAFFLLSDLSFVWPVKLQLQILLLIKRCLIFNLFQVSSMSLRQSPKSFLCSMSFSQP